MARGDINSTAALKFAVVRDPYSRILSCYLNKLGERCGKRAVFARGPAGAWT